MSFHVVLFLAGLSAFVLLAGSWFFESRRHVRKLSRLGLRVHVNGIRGKSTVTRIVAGMLREAGIRTLAKSTGTAAAVIDPEGDDVSIRRAGPATIQEQIDVVADWVNDDTDAVVIECMALKPAYQAISESMIVHSNIGVITNIREDHQDVLGETLGEIAGSLLNTCPRNGVLVTAEQDPAIRRLLVDGARQRDSTVIFADPDWVSEDDLRRFEYIAFKENVAIGLAIAFLLGIPRDVAMDGMVGAAPDPGVLRTRSLEIGGKSVTWANLFAVNDRESMIMAMEKLEAYRDGDTLTVGILNNRSDRERRALQFADVAVQDLSFDRLATFGAYEEAVTARLVRNAYPRERIVNLGEDRHPSIDEIVEELILKPAEPHILLVGFVNIHTRQADMLLDYFEGLTGVHEYLEDEPVPLIDDPEEVNA